MPALPLRRARWSPVFPLFFPRAQRSFATIFAPRRRSWPRRLLGFLPRFLLSLALGALAWNGVSLVHDQVTPVLADQVIADVRPLVSPIVFCTLTLLSAAMTSFLVFRLSTRRRRGILP